MATSVATGIIPAGEPRGGGGALGEVFGQLVRATLIQAIQDKREKEIRLKLGQIYQDMIGAGGAQPGAAGATPGGQAPSQPAQPSPMTPTGGRQTESADLNTITSMLRMQENRGVPGEMPLPSSGMFQAVPDAATPAGAAPASMPTPAAGAGAGAGAAPSAPSQQLYGGVRVAPGDYSGAIEAIAREGSGSPQTAQQMISAIQEHQKYASFAALAPTVSKALGIPEDVLIKAGPDGFEMMIKQAAVSLDAIRQAQTAHTLKPDKVEYTDPATGKSYRVNILRKPTETYPEAAAQPGRTLGPPYDIPPREGNITMTGWTLTPTGERVPSVYSGPGKDLPGAASAQAAIEGQKNMVQETQGVTTAVNALGNLASMLQQPGALTGQVGKVARTLSSAVAQLGEAQGLMQKLSGDPEVKQIFDDLPAPAAALVRSNSRLESAIVNASILVARMHTGSGKPIQREEILTALRQIAPNVGNPRDFLASVQETAQSAIESHILRARIVDSTNVDKYDPAAYLSPEVMRILSITPNAAGKSALPPGATPIILRFNVQTGELEPTQAEPEEEPLGSQ